MSSKGRRPDGAPAVQFVDPLQVMTTPAPRISEKQVERILEREYGVKGFLKSLVSERDRNFVIDVGDDGKRLLKITNPAEDPRVTDFQTGALLHVAEHDPGFPVPRIIMTVAGRPQAQAEDADGRRCAVRLLSWLNGTPLATLDARPDIAGNMGALLARLGLALEAFSHPGSSHLLLWDLKNAMNLAVLLENVGDAALRALCRDRLMRFDEAIRPALNNLRQQVIYNDLNPSNLLVDPAEPESITGVIDFGDMVHSPLIADVAVGAAYLCTAHSDPLAQVRRFVAGFNAKRPLADAEFDVLFDLIMTRQVMTIVITRWRAAQYPENRQYILRNEPRARETLACLAEMDPATVRRELRAACNG